MNDLDRRIRDAFDEVVLPEEVRERAMRAIDRLAASSPSDGSADAPSGAEGCASPPARPGASAASHAAAPRPRRLWSRRAAVALAACSAMALVGAGGFSWCFQKTAYVGIDINPSVELALNRFNTVVSVEALNGDGEALLAEVALEGLDYGDAMEALTSSSAFSSYAKDDAFVEISVTANDERQAESLQSESNACLRGLSCKGACHEVDASSRESARAAGMGVGRYRAAKRLMELDESISLEECAAMSMRELRDRIASCEENGPSFEGSGNGKRKSAGHHGNCERESGEGGRFGCGAGRGSEKNF